TPFGIPTIYNATFIGNKPAGTSNRTATFRANGGGKVYNSIFMEQGRGVDIEYKSDANVPESSYDRFVAGDLDMTHNIFWNISDNTPGNVWRITPIEGGWTDSANQVSAAITAIQNYFPVNNDITDPGIQGLSYVSDNSLDPRFEAWEVYSNVKTPTDSFFTPTSYKGAFGRFPNQFWIKDWTALDHYGYLVNDVRTVTSLDKADLMRSFSVFPNPSNGLFTLQAGELKANQPVDIRVLSITGRLISDSQVQPVAGAFQTSLDLSAQPAGVYVIAIRQGDQYAVQKVVKE
ncbi:MAG: T9SS C-terminal target domain-containing protein, partial [Bacteroidetes bacterium]